MLFFLAWKCKTPCIVKNSHVGVYRTIDTPCTLCACKYLCIRLYHYINTYHRPCLLQHPLGGDCVFQYQLHSQNKHHRCQAVMLPQIDTVASLLAVTARNVRLAVPLGSHSPPLFGNVNFIYTTALDES